MRKLPWIKSPKYPAPVLEIMLDLEYIEVNPDADKNQFKLRPTLLGLLYANSVINFYLTNQT